MLRFRTSGRWTLTLGACLCLCAGSVFGQSADPSLVGWWTFDEGSGVTLSDSSGHENHSGATSGAFGWDVDGRIKGAGSFDGVGEFVEMVESPTLNPADALTIALWVKVTRAGTGTPMAMLMKSEFTYGMRFDDANNVEFWIYSDGFNRAETPIDDSFNGDWHHLAGTFDGHDLRLYLDGDLKAETEFIGAINVNAQYFLNIGRNSQGGTANRWWYDGLMDDVRLYHRALSQAEIQKLLTPEFVSLPVPTDGTRQAWPDVRLAWLPGLGVQTHSVYLGTEAVDVHNATAGDPRGVLAAQLAGDVTEFDPGGLALGQTYYWRIDEVQSGTVYPGEVWHFSVPTGFQVEQVNASASTSFSAEVLPDNSVNGSGLDGAGGHSAIETDMWLSDFDPAAWIEFEFDRVYQLHELTIWNYNSELEFIFGFGIRTAEIHYSVDGVTWTPLGDVPEFTQGPSVPGYVADTVIPFGAALARRVRMVPTSSWGGLPQYGLSEVQFSYLPTHTSEPMPAPGATTAGLDFLLQWRPGRGGVEHDLHVSNDLDALRDGRGFAARLQESQFDSAGLKLLYGETLYWKVDEINELALPARVEGDIWRFSILDYLVVDDMESYRDEEFLEIWATWMDGFEDPANGALVGNGAAGTPETGIVHGGLQSMPVYYDNSGIGAPAMVSEVERTWSAPQDWQRGMPDTLTLNVYGDPNNGSDTLYVALEDGRGTSSRRVVRHPDPTVLQGDSWQVWAIPLSDFGSVNLASITKMAVGVGNPDAPRLGGSGVFYLDDIRVSRSGP